jgi:hypothetical protein
VLSDEWFIRSTLARGRCRYLTIQLPKLPDEQKRRTVTIHSLVALAFIGPCPQGQIVRHGTAGYRVNTVANLSYGTRAENDDDTKRDRTRKGENNPRAKLTWHQVAAIRRSLAAGSEGKAIAREYGVSTSTISGIKTKLFW